MIIIKLLINNMDAVFEEVILLLFYCRELLEYKWVGILKIIYIIY